ncbi:MAG: hypothetical protein Q8M91_13140, partial [Polaromonas sp.]|nr:hypothetical protein [Polaromonas sp.]
SCMAVAILSCTWGAMGGVGMSGLSVFMRRDPQSREFDQLKLKFRPIQNINMTDQKQSSCKARCVLAF